MLTEPSATLTTRSSQVARTRGVTHRIAIAGSHDVDPSVAFRLFRLIARLGYPTILLRRGRSTPPGPLERELSGLCRSVGFPVEWWQPAPGGRDEVFFRDIDLVTGADLVLAVFSSEHVMTGGTGHVVEKAIDQRVPAYAFVYRDSALERVGEYDPDNAWGSFVDRL